MPSIQETLDTVVTHLLTQNEVTNTAASANRSPLTGAFICALLVPLLLLTACAELPENQDTQAENVLLETETAQLRCTRPCILRPASQASPITRKLNSLPADLRESSFAQPLSDEFFTPDSGKCRFFRGSTGDGAIYDSPESPTPPYAIYGAILQLWASIGYEQSFLGYPASDETDAVGACADQGAWRQQQFDWSTLCWEPARGVWLAQ